MNAIIDAAQQYSRTVLSFLALIFAIGTVSYVTIPKEASPDVNIPFIYVSLHLSGISPQDSERLLLKPMEQELAEVSGVKVMTSTGYQGGGNILLEFDAGFDADAALDEIREQVDKGKGNLPAEADEPTVTEVNFADMPVVVLTLSGSLPERALLRLAQDLQDRIESIPAVLEATIGGDREEQVEIIIDPLILESYGLDISSVAGTVARANTLVAAGAITNDQGQYAVKIPGLFEDLEDIFNMPIKVDGDAVIRFRDVATITRTFKDPQGFARVNGLPTLSLEIKKRAGANIIQTIDDAKAKVKEAQVFWPEGVQVTYSGDQSKNIEQMLNSLANNVIAAILLVMIVVIGALGLRSGTLVGLAVPGSFLLGFAVLYTSGLTVNMIVLFALILASGMLVDGAVVVTEYADRKMAEGATRLDAFREASKRMAWPIIASTATTLAAFAPLAFWPGMVGEFMKYLPITLLVTLSASLLMALIFIPVLGVHLETVIKLILGVLSIALAAVLALSPFGEFIVSLVPGIDPSAYMVPPGEDGTGGMSQLRAGQMVLLIPMLVGGFFLGRLLSWLVVFLMDDSDREIVEEPQRPEDIRGLARVYAAILGPLLRVPYLVVIAAAALMVGSWALYFGSGGKIEFFPQVEPENATVLVRARGNLSIYEKDRLLQEVENEILRLHQEQGEFHSIYARSQNSTQGGGDQPEDTIGTVQLEFSDWFSRRPADQILDEVRDRVARFSGVEVEINQVEAGPPTGKDVQLQLSSSDPAILDAEARRIATYFRTVEGLRDIDDGLPLPGIEWELNVDRAQAAKFGVDVGLVGTYVRLITNGVKVTSYRPDDSNDEIDVVVRLPEEYRSITQLDKIRIQTQGGAVPIASFVEREAKQKVNTITRVDQSRVRTLKADAATGINVVDKVNEVTEYLKANPLDPRVQFEFKGENQEQAEAAQFLMTAFGVALFIMAVILITQFNSFFSAILILLSVIMSTIGVMLGLWATGQSFSVVMTGIGIVALAGIVVNNNIILIDTYDQMKKTATSAYDAVLLTGAQRLRPVLLTTFTTILGLIPMVIGLNIDWVTRVTQFGAPSAQWWIQLSSAIVYGLGFATILTLVVTPCALKLFADITGEFRNRAPAGPEGEPEPSGPIPAKPILGGLPGYGMPVIAGAAADVVLTFDGEGGTTPEPETSVLTELSDKAKGLVDDLTAHLMGNESEQMASANADAGLVAQEATDQETSDPEDEKPAGVS